MKGMNGRLPTKNASPSEFHKRPFVMGIKIQIKKIKKIKKNQKNQKNHMYILFFLFFILLLLFLL